MRPGLRWGEGLYTLSLCSSCCSALPDSALQASISCTHPHTQTLLTRAPPHARPGTQALARRRGGKQHLLVLGAIVDQADERSLHAVVRACVRA